MENYSYSASYPESGDSSPRSREIEFENPPPWEDQPPSSDYRIKFMCSYGGKIHPRPHDNQLSYVGGETKILAVDRNIKFSGMISKLSGFCDVGVCFKYQLPGEDLDALISVTNDEDLEHMMHEYDRLFRASAKPARLRLFIFPENPPPSSFDSNEGKSDHERFLDALNSCPIQSVPTPTAVTTTPEHTDFLFGSDKAISRPAAVEALNQIPDRAALEREIPERIFGSDPIRRQVQEMQRLQIGGQEQPMYRRKSDDNLIGAGLTRDYYYQKMPENLQQSSSPVNVSSPVALPAGYWPEKQIVNGVSAGANIGSEQQPVYMIQAPANMYHAPMGRPVTGPIGQGYYATSRMAPDVYRDQPVYNVMPQMASAPAPPPSAVPQPQQPQKVGGGYPENIGMVRPQNMGGPDSGYAQVAYDTGGGRHVFYTAQGGVMPQQYQAMPAGALNQEGKVVAKVTQTSV